MKIGDITEGIFDRVRDRIRTGIDNFVGQQSLESLGYLLGVANTIGLEFFYHAIGKENVALFLEAVQMARSGKMLDADRVLRSIEEGIRDAQQADSTLTDMVQVKFDKLKAGMNYIRGNVER